MRFSSLMSATLCAATALCVALPSHAADLRVLSAGAIRPLAEAEARAFERETNHHVTVDGGTAGALLKRAQGGEAFDVLIVTKPGIDTLAQAGTITGASARPLARVGIGAAVKQGAPLPDISSTAAFRETLLKARSVAMIDPRAGGSSGIYLAKLFERLDIARDMAAKAVLVPGGLTAQLIVSGEADLALQQISELHEVPGVQVVGPIPAELQNYTVYAGGISASSRDAAAAQALLDRLTKAIAQGAGRDHGVEAP